MYPPYPPSSAIGQLQTEIGNIKRELNNKANSYEINSLNSRLDSLEHSLSEIRAEITGIWNRLSELQTNEV